MMKLLIVAIILTSTFSVATDVQSEKSESVCNKMMYKINGFSTTMPHHIQRFLESPHKYQVALGTKSKNIRKFLKVYDGTDKKAIKRINSKNDITDIPTFASFLNEDYISTWSTYANAACEEFHSLHVLVGFKSSDASNEYYQQKLERKTQNLSVDKQKQN